MFPKKKEMAGASDKMGGIAKYRKVNRDEYAVNDATWGTSLHQYLLQASQQALVISATQAINDIVFSDGIAPHPVPASPAGPYTGPSAAQIMAQLASIGMRPQVDSSYTVTYWNQTALPITINFGAGMTPASLVIPANSVNDYTFKVDAVQPPAIELFQTVTNSPPGAADIDNTDTTFTTAAVLFIAPGSTTSAALNFLENQITTEVDDTDTTLKTVSERIPGVRLTDILNNIYDGLTTAVAQSAPLLVIGNGAWTAVPAAFVGQHNTILPNSVFSAFAGPPTTGITFNINGNPAPMIGPLYRLQLSAEIGTLATNVVGSFGIRIVVNGVGGTTIAQNTGPTTAINEVQSMSTMCVFPAAAAATFHVEVFNRTGGGIQIDNVNLHAVFLSDTS